LIPETMAAPIQLLESGALAKGHSRLVFQHPHHPDRLIKVIRPDVIDERFGSGAAWYKRLRRFGRYLSFARETQEYLAAWASHGCELPFVQRIIGFEATSLGLGLVMEAARDRNGNLAPTLRDVILSGRFDAATLRLLDRFLDLIHDADIVISDLNVVNIVLAHTGPDGDHFILIDGIGNNSPLPFKSHIRTFNRRSKRGRIRRLRRKIAELLDQSGHPAP
jgi:PhoP regulatory network protein YrbL